MNASAGIAVALALFAQAAVPPPSREGDVTVTGRRIPKTPIRDAIGYWQRHCFDAARLTGAPSTPRSDPDWRRLGAQDRSALRVAEADPAFGMRNADGQLLVITLSSRRPADNLIEHRCTLIVSGGDQARFEDRVGAIFGGSGTRKHVDEVDGIPAVPGWRQLLWAAIPAIGSRDWRVFRTREAKDTWILVTSPDFFDEAEYVRGDLRVREAGPALSQLTLIYTRRPRRNEREDGS